jgi:anti-anti-sigma regulatory factor
MDINKNRIILPSIADSSYAYQLFELLTKSFKKNEPIEIDASSVEKISGITFQLILSAVKSYKQINEPFVFITPSDYFLEVCDLLMGNQNILIKE